MTEAKLVHGWASSNHHNMFEFWDNYTGMYINAFSLQTRNVTKSEQELRANGTANPTPMVMPLTQ
jgi:hypothetical protein